MPTCLLVAAVISCTNLSPMHPAEAARIVTASINSWVGPYVPLGGPVSATIPWTPPPPQSPIAPLSPQWSTMTTYFPRFGPPRTVFDGGRRRGLARIIHERS